MIDRATIDKIMDAVDIVDVVSEFVQLRKAGINYKGLCPFHDDTTPSFVVSPAKGICHCFACGKGGNAVNFLMEHEQMTYPEALRWLARKYNIEIKERQLSDEERQQAGERESMYIVNEWAKGYFQDILHKNRDGQALGMQYYRTRGFRDDIIEKFQLGFALPQRDALASEAARKGYKAEYLVKTGLCYKRDNGELVDRYAGRVIFPWLNVGGKVNAFGGRLLDSRTKGVQQKYVNSPESDIFHKDHELYGLYQAKRSIVKEDFVYMVEGYTDVLSMHQCGIENVVANSGTALSVHQIRLLHRFTSNIVLLYDGDAAGIHAAMRGTDMLLAEGMNVKALLIPDDDDPDSFARKHTAEEFRKYMDEHKTDFIRFKSRILLNGVDDPIKRSEAISNIVKSVSVIPDTIKRDTYLHECASDFGISERTLLSSMNNFIRSDIEAREKAAAREVRSPAVGVTPEAGQASEPIGLHSADERLKELETLIVEQIIKHGEEVIYDNIETEDGQTVSLTVAQYVDYDLSSDKLSFSDPIYNRILAEAVSHSHEDGFKAEAYFTHHPDVEISGRAGRLAAGRYQLSKGMEEKRRPGMLRQKVEHLVLDYRKGIMEQKLKDIKTRLRASLGDAKQTRRLMEELVEAQQIRDALAKKLGNDIVV